MLENLAVGALVESGEVFFRIVRRKFGKSTIPLALEIIESDLLDDEYSGKPARKGNEWRMGIEVDKFGRPQRYAFLNNTLVIIGLKIIMKTKSIQLLTQTILFIYISKKGLVKIEECLG